MLRRIQKAAMLVIASIALWPLSWLFMNPDSDAPAGLLFHGEWALDVAIVMAVAAVAGFVIGMAWLSMVLFLSVRSRAARRTKVDLPGRNP